MDLYKVFFVVSDEEVFFVNNCEKEEFEQYFLTMISKIKKSHKEKYWKYDILNGIISRLQNNENLSQKIYLQLNKLRDLLWIDNDEYISLEEFKDMIELI
jgi:hypothetical protein